MTKRKKRVVLALSIVVVGAALYCGTWLFYYNVVWMPHLSGSGATQIRKDDLTKQTIYTTMPDEIYNEYSFFMPRFGSFYCYCGAVSAIEIDEAHYTIDADGSKRCESVTMSGSAFDYSMTAHFGLNGKIKSYFFNISPLPPQEKYAKSVTLEVRADGTLLNEEEQSKKGMAIYSDALPEMLTYIDKLNEIFALE